MSLMDLLTSSDFKKNQIPVINQIISSKNPEDGEIYRTYFMDDQIFCNNADGKKHGEYIFYFPKNYPVMSKPYMQKRINWKILLIWDLQIPN